MAKSALSFSSHPPHLLVVDDDTRLRALLEEYLTREGFMVSVAADATDARALLPLWRFDAVVLDVMMPGENGVQLTGWLQKTHPQLPVLLLTAQGAANDRIAGLEAGAQDYLAKPFEPRELLLRLRNIIKNTMVLLDEAVMFGPYRLALESGECWQDDAPLPLTEQERALLKQLALAQGEAVAREALAATLGMAERHVDVAIGRLRKKIEPNAAHPRYILTVRGAGYRLRMERD